MVKLWWVRPDLNQRPRHLQCRALPTRLLTRAGFANPLAISSLPLRRMRHRVGVIQDVGHHSAPLSASFWKTNNASMPLSAPLSKAVNSSAEKVDSSPVP